MQMPAKVRKCRGFAWRSHELYKICQHFALWSDYLYHIEQELTRGVGVNQKVGRGQALELDWTGKWSASFKSGYESMEQGLEVGQKWESVFRSSQESSGGQIFKP